MSKPPDPLISDLLALVRRHDPAWTGSNDSDPGVTLLEIGAWIAERLDFAGGISVSPTVVSPAARRDPYRDFNFRVKLDGSVVAGVTQVSTLRRTTEIVEFRDGSAPEAVQRLPGRQLFEPFALLRPLGKDTAFEDWAADPSLRKNVRIEILDQAGRLFLAYDVLRCWPTAYQILPSLTESLTLLPEAWQRDRSVQPGA